MGTIAMVLVFVGHLLAGASPDPDAAVVVGGHLVQVEYLGCLADDTVRWYDDGSPEGCEGVS